MVESNARIYELIDSMRSDIATVKTDMAVLKTELRNHCQEQDSGSVRKWETVKIFLQIFAVLVPLGVLLWKS